MSRDRFRRRLNSSIYPEFSADGHIYVASGTSTGVSVTRLDRDGQTDVTFGTSGSTDVSLGGVRA
jgi:hypothetical protein